TADWPGAMLPTPRIGTESATSFEMSSMVQPVMLTAAEPTLVTSNQSAAYMLAPLPQGATSVMTSLSMSGEPTSLASPAASSAPPSAAPPVPGAPPAPPPPVPAPPLPGDPPVSVGASPSASGCDSAAKSGV